MNHIAGIVCPPVICKRSGPAFQWHDGKAWQTGNDLPPAIVAALPEVERDRCTRHRRRRIDLPEFLLCLGGCSRVMHAMLSSAPTQNPGTR